MISYAELLEMFTTPWVPFAVAIGCGFLAGLVLVGLLKIVERRSRRPIMSSSAGRVKSFAFLTCIVYALKIGVNAFELDPSILKQLNSAGTFLIFLLITWAVNRIYDSIHENIIIPWSKKSDNTTLAQIGLTFAHTLLWVLGIVSGLSSAGYNVTAVLAGLGVGGLALALAAQDTVANIFGGIVVLTQNPFRVGDNIEIMGQKGWVNSIGIRSTVIDTWKGYKVTLPNKVFTDSPVINVDSRTEYWENLQLKLRHDCTLEQIEQAQGLCRELIMNNEDILDATWIGVCNLGEGFVEIEVWYGIRVWTPEESEKYFNFYAKLLGVKNDFLMGVLRGLENEGIALATPVAGRILFQDEAVMKRSRF
ncbi:MAG: mechanosensitive ion channel family protein, partial [Nannocystaceae bacterium]